MGTRPMVHAGFQGAWQSAQKQVVQRVLELVQQGKGAMRLFVTGAAAMGLAFRVEGECIPVGDGRAGYPSRHTYIHKCICFLWWGRIPFGKGGGGAARAG